MIFITAAVVEARAEVLEAGAGAVPALGPGGGRAGTSTSALGASGTDAGGAWVSGGVVDI